MTVRVVVSTFLCWMGARVGLGADAGTEGASPWRIAFDKPACRWLTEAQPLGNGRFGCMVFGDPLHERIQFNENSLWTGDGTAAPGALQVYVGAYQNFGDILIEMEPGPDDAPTEPYTIKDGKPCFRPDTLGRLPSWPEPAAKLFHSNAETLKFSYDGHTDTKWVIEHTGKPAIWELRFPPGREKALNAYTITSRLQPGAERDPRTWEFSGSNDGQTWVLLHRSENEARFADRGKPMTFSFANNKTYTFYRLTFPTTQTPDQYIEIAEIGIPGVDLSAGVGAGYRRELDIGRALHTLTYRSGAVTYRRETFVSYPDQALVVRFTADRPGSHSGVVRLQGAHDETTVIDGRHLVLGGKLKNGLEYEARLGLLSEGGSCTTTGRIMRFQKCNAVTLLMAAGTSYLMDPEKGFRGPHPRERLLRQLNAASAKPFERLKADHIADFRALFDRVDLSLSCADPARRDMPMDKRCNEYRGDIYNIAVNLKKDMVDFELEALMFQYGRYLLISCSRPGAAGAKPGSVGAEAAGLPANLQGLWCDSIDPVWSSDYHVNINVQMNYWLAEQANLAECHLPFLNLVQSQLPLWRKATAAAPVFQIGAGPVRGWALHVSHNIYGGSDGPFGDWDKTANAWYCQHFWLHYEFGRDREYLKTVAYPIIKEICEFWEDHLKVLPDGRTVVPNGWSPEHGPVEDGVTYSQEIVWDLLSNYIEAADALGVDKPYRDRIASLRDKLLLPKIGRWGQLQEWMDDRDDPKDDHRHTSHLFGVHPGRRITRAGMPDLAKAAGVSLAARGDTSDSARSWTWPWRCAIWARLGEPENAHRMVRGLLCNNLLPNMFTTHPPFQIDGNLGITAGMCEMLLQSHERASDGGAQPVKSTAGDRNPTSQTTVLLHLLPALPKAWAAGSYRGLCARGGFEVSARWENGKPVEAEILSRCGQPVALRAPSAVSAIKTQSGKNVNIARDGEVVRFSTKTGEYYHLAFHP